MCESDNGADTDANSDNHDHESRCHECCSAMDALLSYLAML